MGFAVYDLGVGAKKSIPGKDQCPCGACEAYRTLLAGMSETELLALAELLSRRAEDLKERVARRRARRN